jgi:hypothetical protein
MWWPTVTNDNGPLDEAVEVSDAEVLLEELMEGDSEPSGISLGSQDSESDVQAAQENEERDSSFSSPSHSSSECEAGPSDKSECEVMNTCGKAGSSLLPASQDREEHEEEVLELEQDEEDEQDDNNEQPDSVPANEATRKNASPSSSHDREEMEENDADSVAARNAKKFKR